MGGPTSVFGDRKKLLLKPNFVIPEMKPSNTHPDFYMAIAETLQGCGYSVTIGESPAFGSAESALRKHGVLKECRDKGIGVLTFRKNRTIEGMDGHKRWGKLTIAAELEEFDGIVNLPKVKVHQQFVFTGATKNLYGCVVGKRKAHRHFVSDNDLAAFAKMIIVNAKAVSPVLNVADGIEALHVRGPRGGEPFSLGRILLSDDFFEMDWVMATMIGLNPPDTPLFSVFSDTDKATLVRACAPVFELEELPDVSGFIQSFRTPIEFGFKQMVRSVFKSITKKFAR
jgi:uncharacterized protein (DUF362 family)